MSDFFMLKTQLFATSWLGLGKAETPITADKSEIFDFPKLPSATSFIRNTLYEIPNPAALGKINKDNIICQFMRKK